MAEMNRPKALPSALANSDNFRSLTDSQRRTFIERLLYIEETAEKYSTALERLESAISDSMDFRGMLDDLELDIATNVVTSADAANETLTCWAMHVTWAHEARPAIMNVAICDQLKQLFEDKQTFFDSKKSPFLSSLKTNLKGIGLSLDGFYAAATFDAVIAHLMVLDAILVNILRNIYCARLNPEIFTRESKIL